MQLYFNSAHLPSATGEYVLWCDGMGTGRALMTSLHHAANFIFKLHHAFGAAVTAAGVGAVYPIMDGMYVSAPLRKDMERIIRHAFQDLAEEFLNHAGDIPRQFMVRGGVAYGPTIHGASIAEEAFVHGVGTQHEAANRAAFQVSRLNQTRSHLLLSSAMVPAYNSESSASPFGVFIDDSALSVPQLVDPADRGFPSKMWRWWHGSHSAHQVAGNLANAVLNYLNQAETQTHGLSYPVDAITKHRNLAKEYFAELLT